MKALEHIHDIGNMDEVFRILAPVSSINEYGEEVITYTPSVGMMGEFELRTHEETIDSAQITAHTMATLTTRFIPGVTEKHRVHRALDESDWDIIGIRDVGRRRFHIFTLKKSK